MSKFKVGDVVLRNHNPSGRWQEFAQQTPSTQYTVTAVNGRWIQVNGYSFLDDTCPFLGTNFTLAAELQDDELPPAPESVSYYNSYIVGQNDQYLVLDGYCDYYPDKGLMFLGIVPRGSTRATKEIGINMDADAALQLAHDLTRMAMEIKRKEKQDD